MLAEGDGAHFSAPPVLTVSILCAARERPRLPLRREVARRIKDENAVTEGEIHRVCAKALDIDNGKSKWPLFRSVLVCTSEQTATSRYLSLSQALFILKGLTPPSSEGGEAAPPQAAEFALPSHRGGREVRSVSLDEHVEPQLTHRAQAFRFGAQVF